MTQTCTSLLTAVTILAHAVVGCCWHSHSGEAAHCHWSSCGYEHSHDHGPAFADVHSHASVCPQSVLNGCQTPEPQSPEPATPVTCEHSACVYVQTESSLSAWQGQYALTVGWIDSAAASRAETLPLNALAGRRDRNWDEVPVDAARLRAHLQVWLV